MNCCDRCMKEIGDLTPAFVRITEPVRLRTWAVCEQCRDEIAAQFKQVPLEKP